MLKYIEVAEITNSIEVVLPNWSYWLYVVFECPIIISKINNSINKFPHAYVMEILQSIHETVVTLANIVTSTYKKINWNNLAPIFNDFSLLCIVCHFSNVMVNLSINYRPSETNKKPKCQWDKQDRWTGGSIRGDGTDTARWGYNQ